MKKNFDSRRPISNLSYLGFSHTIKIKKKQGDLRNSAQWVSRAPPHHTLPFFLNLNGRKTLKNIKIVLFFKYDPKQGKNLF